MRWDPVALLLASAAFAAPRPAWATCDDRVVDGTESDVDCGGDCGPCEHGSACRTARDCQSGRCAGYECEERPYIEGDPVPPGYRVEYSNTDSSAIVRTIGIISFSAGYAGAYVSALSLPGRLSALYVPVFGPWVVVADGSQQRRGLIALDGAFQIVGFSLLVGGILTGGSQLLREQPMQQADATSVQISVGPARGGGYQLGLTGRF
jgi:hypothetical protein